MKCFISYIKFGDKEPKKASIYGDYSSVRDVLSTFQHCEDFDLININMVEDTPKNSEGGSN